MTVMKREIFAAYGGLSAGDLGRIMADRDLNPSTQAELLATALAMPFKETARSHYRSLMEVGGSYNRQISAGLSWVQRLGLESPAEPDFTILPTYSFTISFQFMLAQPYLSKDDDAFYIIDNPVRKDKVFKTPMVAPSSWKGSLRHALWQLGHRHGGKEYTDEQVKRMFGEAGGDETGLAGRLFFYPTFFDRMSLEIINPHDRVRRVGKNPILFESVPPGAKGRFTLLYVPFDRIAKDEAETRRQVAADLTLLAEGLQAMFTLYGFGAKTSSGFGLAEDSLVGQGSLILHMEDRAEATEKEDPAEDPLQALQADIDAFVERFGVPSFPRWTNKELSASGWGKKRQSKYKKLRNRHPDWDAQVGQWREATKTAEAEEEPAPPPLTERTFVSFSELLETSRRLKSVLSAGGDA